MGYQEVSFSSTYHRIKTALLSGKKSAYFGMFILGISPLTNFIDRLLTSKKRVGPKIFPCIYIVSPPRSGGTIAYQVLSRSIPSAYITNLHALFPRKASSILKKSKTLSKRKHGFNNYYGYSYGFAGVNEGNNMIGGLYSQGRSSEKIREEFLKFYGHFAIEENTPLIFKNVKHYDKIVELHKAVPEIIFVRIKRNIEQVAQSELQAFYKLGYFNPIPDSIAHLYGKIPPQEFVVKQIQEIENQLDAFSNQIDRNKYCEISYEDLCKDPSVVIKLIMENYLKIDKGLMVETDVNLKASFSKKVNEKDEELLRTYIDRPNG